MTPERLADEIEDQLQSDMLYYGWIRQIVTLEATDLEANQVADVVVEALTALYLRGRILIGTCGKTGEGLLCVAPFAGSSIEVLAKMEAIVRSDDGSLQRLEAAYYGYSFWIERTDL